MVQAVCFDGLVVKPRTVTGFPLEAADHAELGTAATGHMITAFFQFNGGFAVVTALPAFLFSDPDEFLGCCVFGTFARGVPSIIAEAADFGPTSLAFAVLPAMVRTTTSIRTNICRLDPLAALSSWAVNAILSCIFLKFLVPEILEFIVKQPIYVFERNHVRCAARRRHMLGIGDRQIEDAAQAGEAHSMVAFELDSPRCEYIV